MARPEAQGWVCARLVEMPEDRDDQSLDEWIAFADHDHGIDEHGGSWRHPLVYTTLGIGLLVVIGLILLRPTGEAQAQAQAERSVLGLPTDSFAAEVSTESTGPCDFLPDETCSTVSFLILEGPDSDRTYVQVFTVGGTNPEFDVGQKVVLAYRAPNGRIAGVADGPCDFDGSQTCDIVDVVLTTGDRLGETITMSVVSGLEEDEYDVGEDVEVTFDESGEAIALVTSDVSNQYRFSDFERTPLLIIVFIAFAVAVIVLGRWRGVAALAALGVTLLIVLVWLLPAILDGRDPALVALVGASAVAYIALYVSHGVSLMTTIALLGTLAALLLTTVLSAVTVHFAEFTGLATEESTLLTLFHGIDVRGLVLAGMVLGAAGALDDVTVTQASAVWQLVGVKSDAAFDELWRAGIRIGQHHIGSTVNTLLLAYLGASLPLAVLFVLAAQSLGSVVNSEVVAVEVVRTLVGSIGLIAAVPITTWLAARVASSPRRG